MVDKVAFSGGYSNNLYNADLERVAKYVTGTSLVASQDNPLSGMGLMLGITGVIETPKVVSWFKNAKQNGGVKAAWAKDIDTIKEGAKNTKALFANGNFKNPETYATIWRNYGNKLVEESIPSAEKLAELAKTARGKDAVEYYNMAQDSLKIAADTPAEAKNIANMADRALTKANSLAHGAVPAKGVFGKIGEFFGKITGVSKFSGWVKNLANESPIVSKILKFAGKGNALNVAITGGMELFTQVIPAFSLGANKGIKQLGKSAVKTAANIGGWAAGAAVGGAVGSIIPGAGTLIGGLAGAVIGMIGGSLGAWGAEKIAQGIVGKDETEIASEEKAKELAKKAKDDPTGLMQDAVIKLKQSGTDSEDAKIAFQSLNRLSKYAQVQPQSSDSTTVASTTAGTASPQLLSYANLGFKARTTGLTADDMNKDFMSLSQGLIS